jgi:uncharacterized repeat protein (TIGR02543 family)
MKKIIIFIYSFIIILFSFIIPSTITLETIQVMSYIESEEDAHQIAYDEQLDLLSVSTFGFAVFEAKISQLDRLLAKGFDINGEYEITGGKITPLTNDPYLNDQYALDMMNIPEAWTLTEGSPDVLIAIIDTGIDTDHQEFVGRISQLSYNSRTKVTSSTSLSHIEDDNGHGTHVAGVIGANKNNNVGIAGIVQQSQLLIIKANNENDPSTEEDESENFMDASIAEGIHYARLHGADIINLSLGTSSINALTRDAIEAAVSAGILVVGASGNDGDSDRYYPASYPGVISVGSVDASAIHSTFSNYNDALDIVAPGEAIVTSGLNNAYFSVSGTSLAAPQVAGVLGLLIAAYPTFSSTQITDLLINSATDRGILGYDIYYGYGLVNAAEALSIEYITVQFETAGGTIMDPLSVVSGWPFVVDDPVKVGHQFLGWYKDQAFTIPFEIGVDTSTTNLTLYAKFEPLLYLVSFISSGSYVAPIEVPYNTSITPPESERTGYEFLGWFYDETFVTPYLGQPITEPTVLYAYFQPILYQVTYYVGNDIYDTVSYPYGTAIEPINPISEYPFIGWYLSDAFIQLYQSAPIDHDFSLYARFNDGQYQVTFYDSDGESILSTMLIMYGDQAVAPDAPLKEDTPSFSYTFSGWSEPFDNITEDLNIYPVYERTYLAESVYLNPGIDTVDSLDTWLDGGLHSVDPILSLVTTMLELSETTIKITYEVYDGEILLDTKIRMVTIRDQEPVIILLNPDITTVLVGDSFEDSGAVASKGDISTRGEVDTSTPGIYELVYSVSFGDTVYEKTKYVYVLDKTEYHPTLIISIIPEKRWWIL